MDQKKAKKFNLGNFNANFAVQIKTYGVFPT